MAPRPSHLRAEKGFIIIVGQDTDGTVTPDDAGLSWAISKSKTNFVGKRSLSRPDMIAPGRKKLVGLRTMDPSKILDDGAQILGERYTSQPPYKSLGHVTSTYWSESLQRSVAMDLLADGHTKEQERLYVPQNGEWVEVEVCGVVAYNPEGGRINA